MALARFSIVTTAVALSLIATTATADLTAQNVWSDWRAYIEGMGYTVTATETLSSDKLSVNDIAVVSSGGPEIEAITVRLGNLQFIENVDGSVNIGMPASMPIIIDVIPTGDEPSEQIGVTYTQNGQVMTVSGDATAIVYDYTADTFALALTSLTRNGVPTDMSNSRFSLSGTDLNSQTSVNASTTRSYVQNIEIGNIAYDLLFTDLDNGEGMSIYSTLADIAFSGTSNLPVDKISQAQDLAALLAAGFAFDGKLGTKTSETQIEITSEEGTSKIKTASARSALSVAVGSQGINYGVDVDQVQMGGQLAGLPFPLFVEMESYGFALLAPVMKSDDPQDFELAFNMTDFTMSDIIWALFDPSNQLPRDPATVALDLSGQAKVLANGLSPQSAQKMAASGEVPAEVSALKIDRLTVDAIGAKIDATGDVTFDNTGTTTLAGFPKPVGDINIDIAGANGLMDKLTAMGLLPTEQAMGARIMMGLFAVPGATPDTLKSKIEFNENGQISANGQRIK